MRAGALEENEYRGKLAAAGFEQIEVEPTRIYRIDDAANSFPAKESTWMPSLGSGRQVHERIHSRREARAIPIRARLRSERDR